MGLRDELNYALGGIVRLERGEALPCGPITDGDQREVLMNAKTHILRALEIEGKQQKEIYDFARKSK